MKGTTFKKVTSSQTESVFPVDLILILILRILKVSCMHFAKASATTFGAFENEKERMKKVQ